MKIIKDINEDLYRVLAGEMLNIETSTYHYVDGKPPGEDRKIVLEEYRGYPKVHHESVVYTIKAVMGYIFIPRMIEIDQFEAKLIAAIKFLESTYERADGRPTKPILEDFQSFTIYNNTNVRLKSAAKITKDSSDEKHNFRSETGKNVKRRFTKDESRGYRGRFTWVVRRFDEVSAEISSADAADAIARICCSIFVDIDNICKLGHNEITYDLSKKLLKGYDNLVEETIVLSKIGHPLVYELSEHWVNKPPIIDITNTMRNITGRTVYSREFESIHLKSVIDVAGLASTEICSKCLSVLFGDNYVLAASVANPDGMECVAVCAPCLHSSPADEPLEMKYFRLLRVTFPRTAQDMIGIGCVSEVKKDIRLAALDPIELGSINHNGRIIKFAFIGHKYVAFMNIDDYLFTKLSTDPMFSGKTICHATFVGY